MKVTGPGFQGRLTESPTVGKIFKQEVALSPVQDLLLLGLPKSPNRPLPDLNMYTAQILMAPYTQSITQPHRYLRVVRSFPSQERVFLARAIYVTAILQDQPDSSLQLLQPIASERIKESQPCLPKLGLGVSAPPLPLEACHSRRYNT
jgi:hypothetical protein